MKRKQFFVELLTIAIVLITATSCRKQNDIVKNDGITRVNSSAAIPSYVFDWEKADYMPTPAGVTPILVPWASGSNQLFSDEIAFDFKKSDGWCLVYNTFSPTEVISPNFFALYNKYRGILRFYLYMPPGNPNASSYLSDGLGLSGSFNSSIINFNNELVDLDKPITSTTRVQNYQIQSTGAWYACQYEIAYDPNIVNASQDNLNFVWNLSSTNISNVILNGEANGTLTGTIGTESPGGFSLGKLLGQAVEGAVYATGFKAIGALKIGNDDLQKSMKDGAKSGLAGAVKGFLNAILGGSPSEPQVVNLTLKTKIDLKGTISNSAGIAKPTLAIPGTKTGNLTVGYLPAYNDPLGVVYSTQKPTIRVITKTHRLLKRWPDYPNDIRFPLTEMYREDLEFHDLTGTSTLVFNQKLIDEGVTFSVLKQELVVPFDEKVEYLANIGSPTNYMGWPAAIDIDGYYNESDDHDIEKRVEKIGTQNYAIFSPKPGREAIIGSIRVWAQNDFIGTVRWKDASERFTIKVTPPNGGSPIIIVKTFKANPVG